MDIPSMAMDFIDTLMSVIMFLIPVVLFLSGALTVTLCWLFGRKLLGRLLRRLTRRYTLCVTGSPALRLEDMLRANGIRVRSIKIIPPAGAAPALTEVHIKLKGMRHARRTLGWIEQGLRAAAGVEDVYTN